MRLEKKYNEREKENEQAKETKSRQWGKKKKAEQYLQEAHRKGTIMGYEELGDQFQ